MLYREYMKYVLEQDSRNIYNTLWNNSHSLHHLLMVSAF